MRTVALASLAFWLSVSLPAQQPNLVPNGDFSNGTASWVVDDVIIPGGGVGPINGCGPTDSAPILFGLRNYGANVSQDIVLAAGRYHFAAAGGSGGGFPEASMIASLGGVPGRAISFGVGGGGVRSSYRRTEPFVLDAETTVHVAVTLNSSPGEGHPWRMIGEVRISPATPGTLLVSSRFSTLHMPRQIAVEFTVEDPLGLTTSLVVSTGPGFVQLPNVAGALLVDPNTMVALPGSSLRYTEPASLWLSYPDYHWQLVAIDVIAGGILLSDVCDCWTIANG